ncbi:hypothetical protein [Arthrobacter sp. PAMC 25486]|uniref:hypothetical protein n=1 Tax=Arthrobacter sp. PAMC 25486 TaxID=1494608 RepID=UPI0012FEF001|nr:hypothetical protein [Arthrobacter sp. PAMC 25486]
MANESGMVAAIPPGDIVDVDQKDESSLLRCSDDGHLWMGLIYVSLVPGADGPGYVQEIKEAWTGKNGWQVTTNHRAGTRRRRYPERCRLQPWR